MWIQALLLAAIVALAVADLRRGGGGARHDAIRRLLLLGFIALAAFSVILPDSLTWVAQRVGVGRGADLVLYALVVAFLSYVATSHRRSIALDRKITVLARTLALDEARREVAARVPSDHLAPDQGPSAAVRETSGPEILPGSRPIGS